MIVAIDPGITGAIATFDRDGELQELVDIPTVEVAVGKKLRRRVDPAEFMVALGVLFHFDTVVLEEMQPQGRNGSLSNFSLGRTYGIVECAVACTPATVVTVRPEAWKKDLGVTADKKGTLALARERWGQDRFPLEKHHNRAEAALIGHWYLTHGGITP